MEENGGDFDIVKIRKTSSKTGQNQFQIFPSNFLNSLGQDGSNGTPCEAVVRPVSKINHCHPQLQYADSNKSRPKPANGIW